MSDVSIWEIAIQTYGTFIYVGTEQDAEEMRRHKAAWEGGIGTKKNLQPATPDQIKRHTISGPFTPIRIDSSVSIHDA